MIFMRRGLYSGRYSAIDLVVLDSLAVTNTFQIPECSQAKRGEPTSLTRWNRTRVAN